MPRREDPRIYVTATTTTASTSASTGTIAAAAGRGAEYARQLSSSNRTLRFEADAYTREPMNEALRLMQASPNFAQYISLPEMWSRHIQDVLRQNSIIRQQHEYLAREHARVMAERPQTEDPSWEDSILSLQRAMDRANIPREGRSVVISEEDAERLRGHEYDAVWVDETGTPVPVRRGPIVRAQPAVPTWNPNGPRRSGTTMEFAPLTGDPEPPR